MRIKIFILTGLAAALAGCSSVAPFDAPIDKHSGLPTVGKVIDKIECEIAVAKDDPNVNGPIVTNRLGQQNPPLKPFNEWVANVTLSLTVNDTEGLSPSSGITLSYIDPLKISGTSFMFGGNPILYQQRSRAYTQTYTIDISKTNQNACRKQWDAFNLEGDLGLRDQIYTGLHSFDPSEDSNGYNIPKTGTPDSFGATVSFDVFKGISNLGPTWTLVRFKGPGGGIGLQRDDLHKFAITFVPVAATTPTVALNDPKSIAKTQAQVVNADLVQRQLLNILTNSINRP